MTRPARWRLMAPRRRLKSGSAGLFPWPGLLGLATVPLAVSTTCGAARFAEDIPKLVPYLGRNVVITIVTPVLLAVGLFIGR